MGAPLQELLQEAAPRYVKALKRAAGEHVEEQEETEKCRERGGATDQLANADFELMRQGVRLEPLLQAIADFLDDQKEMIERVRSDLVRGLKKPGSGRNGLTVPQVLRSLSSDAGQELGLSRTARTDRRRIDAASVCSTSTARRCPSTTRFSAASSD